MNRPRAFFRKPFNKIIDLELKGLYDRVNALGYKVKISNAAKDYIADRGFDANFGARPLKRAIQKYLEDPMAEVLIKSNLSEGDTIQVGFNADTSEIKIKIQKKKPELPEKTDSNAGSAN
jgi:ATP-dependent Clp protease ATP-binding subunit ClpC